MLNVPSEVKQIFKSDRCIKHLSIEIEEPRSTEILTEADIYKDSFKLTESIMDDKPEVVGCISSILEFTTKYLGLTNTNMSGLPISAYMTVEVDDEGTQSDPIPLFHGFIDSWEQQDAGRGSMMCSKVVCYDALAYLNDTPGYNAYKRSFTYYGGGSITMQQFREYIVETFFELEGESQSLCNDAVKIKKRYRNKDFTGLQLIKHICQINGSYGIINRDGHFEYKIFGIQPAEQLIAIYNTTDRSLSVGGALREMKYSKVRINLCGKGLCIRQSSQDAGVSMDWEHYTDYASTDPGWSDDSTDTYRTEEGDEDVVEAQYVIEGNIIAHKLNKNKKKVMAANIMALWHDEDGSVFSDQDVHKMHFPTEYKVVSNGLPYIECGDILQAGVYYGSSAPPSSYTPELSFYVTKRVLSGWQNMIDTFECALDVKYLKTDPESQTSGGYGASTERGTYISNINSSGYKMADDADIELGSKTITVNGTYDAENDGLTGFDTVIVNVEGGGDLGGTPIQGEATADIPAWSTVHIGESVQGNWILVDLPPTREPGTDMGCDGTYFYFRTVQSSSADLYRVPIDNPTATPEHVGYFRNMQMQWDAMIYQDSNGGTHLSNFTNDIQIISMAGKPSDRYRFVQYDNGGTSVRAFIYRGETSILHTYNASSGPNANSMPYATDMHVLPAKNQHTRYQNGNSFSGNTHTYGSNIFADAGSQLVYDGYLWGYASNGQIYKVQIGSANVQEVTGVISTSAYLVPGLNYGCSYLGNGVLLPLGGNGVYYNGEIAPIYGNGPWYAVGNYLFCPGSDKLYKRESLGILISPSEYVSDGAYLGYVKEAIEQGETGTAYWLFH